MANETTPIVRQVYPMQEPPYVSEVIACGYWGIIALLRDDPTRVFKFCSPGRLDAVGYIEREKRMLKIVGSHPFIISPHWVNERGLCFDYYLMGDLRKYYENLRPEIPPLTDRIRWCRETVCGVAYLHSKEIAHSDICARNILLSPTRNVKICDFGFSTTFGEDTVSHGPETRYFRPQNVFSPKKDCLTKTKILDDLFSLGSVFYELLSGHMPYPGVDEYEVWKLYEEHVFPQLDDIRPQGFAELIRKCWNEEYISISALQSDLDDVTWDPSLEMTNGVDGTHPKVPQYPEFSLI